MLIFRGLIVMRTFQLYTAKSNLLLFHQEMETVLSHYYSHKVPAFLYKCLLWQRKWWNRRTLRITCLFFFNMVYPCPCVDFIHEIHIAADDIMIFLVPYYYFFGSLVKCMKYLQDSNSDHEVLFKTYLVILCAFLAGLQLTRVILFNFYKIFDILETLSCVISSWLICLSYKGVSWCAW